MLSHPRSLAVQFPTKCQNNASIIINNSLVRAQFEMARHMRETSIYLKLRESQREMVASRNDLIHMLQLNAKKYSVQSVAKFDGIK